MSAGESSRRTDYDFSASLLDTAPVIILLLDTQGSILYVNSYFERLTGYHLDEVKGREWFATFLPVQDQERIRARFRSTLHDAPGRGYENPIVTRAGEERVIEWSAQSMRDGQGRVTALLSVGRDITERKYAEEKYRNILQTAMDGFWTTDTRGRLLEANEAYCRMSGYSRDELLGMSVPDLEALEKPSETTEHIEKMVALGGDRFESMHRRKDGTVYDVEVSVQYAPQEGGIIVVFIKDITARKRAEMALQEGEERLRQAMDASHDGLWDWNLATGEVYFSPSYFRMLGFEPGELSGGAEIWMERVHPDDRQAALLANQNCIDNRVQNFEVEFRMRSKSGAWIWVLGRGKAVARDAGGAALRLVGTHVDITAIKLAEEKMRAALAEKELLLKEIHHRVKNNLQIIASLLYLQAEKVHEPQVLELLEESRDRIKSMALVHEKFFGARDLARIDFGDYLENLIGYLAHVHATKVRGIRIACDIRSFSLGVDVAVPCGLIVHELISNAFKHAFPGGRPGGIRIAAAVDSADVVTLDIEDDGVGQHGGDRLENAKSLGLRLVRNLVEQLGGTIRSGAKTGTAYHLTFPRRTRAAGGRDA